MIVSRKKSATPNAPRSPDVVTLSSAEGWHLDEHEEAALKVSAVYRCVTYNADTLSIMPTYIMDRDTRKRITDHPLLYPLTIRPNEIMTPSEYKRRMEINRLMDGNAYAFLDFNPKTGRLDQELPLQSDLVTLVFDEQRHLHYLYTDPISGRVYDLAPSQVIHYKAFVRNGVEGISPLTYARSVVRKDLSAKSYERAIYDNGGRPSGILYTEGDLSGDVEISDADGSKTTISRKELVRRAWEKVHSGSGNAFRTAVLDLGLKYQPIAMNNTDAQFVESNDVTIADIARYFGTPLHVLMSGKQSYESNVQNRVEFVQTTALATTTAYEEEDSFKKLSLTDQAKGLRIRRNMDAALRGDTASRAAFYKTMREISAYSVNDVLALEDRPDVPGGDVRQASLNYVPLEDFRDLSRARNPAQEGV